MDHLPIFLKLHDRACLIVGGGPVAERKIRLLLRTGACITVLAPAVTENLQRQIDQGIVAHRVQRFDETIVTEFWLIIAATNDKSLNHHIASVADAAGRLCNVVDDNSASSFILPAIVDRSPVIVAIGTGGNAPVLAQQLKARLEAWLPTRIGELAEQAGRWRELVKKRIDSLRERRRFWQRFFSGAIAEHLLAGRRSAAEAAMRSELVGNATMIDHAEGEAWIVGAGPGDPGLLTLRGQQLISQADVILYDRLVSKPVLDFARKEAELISVGKRAGSQAMSQDDINRLLVELVRKGERVCRLKGGDPFVFGRGGEETLALAKANLPFQVVPGISAALGCAAYAGIPLTHRGVSASVTLATAKLDTDLGPDWPRLLSSGHTLAVYMGVGSISDISQQLASNGVAPDLPIAIVENGTTQNQRTVFSSASAMERDALEAKIKSPAMLFIGQAIRLATQLQWYNGTSLANDFSHRVDGELRATAS